MTRRVAITGVGLASPIGHDLDTAMKTLAQGRHGIRRIDAWRDHPEMLTKLGAPVVDLDLGRWPRKTTRAMGRVARLALHATEGALAQAGIDETLRQSGRLGLAYGSTHGSTEAWEKFALTLETPNALLGLGSNAYLKFASHTCAANLAVTLGIRGRITTTCSACVAAAQAIGAGYEAVHYGMQDVMITGGAEEMHYISTGVFDVLQATSIGDDPDAHPRPFDVARNGLVVGEGAGTLVLEAWDHAQARGATILGELLGYGTSCDGTHITAPAPEGMQASMELALADAGLHADDIDYVNAHATATAVGDAGEAEATWRVFGDRVPVGSTKAYTGHTMGACGAIEAILALGAIQNGFVPASRNLETPDPAFPAIRYVRETEDAKVRRVMSNNFAFGGINTSLILAAC